MNFIIDIFGQFMGWLLGIFSSFLGGNFALSIFLFTIIVNLIFLPSNIKQQKGTAKQARNKNKSEKIKEKYKNDRQRYQEEMGRLYQETGSNPMSGCLLLFIRIPFFIGIYTAIRAPFSYILGVGSDVITTAKTTLFENLSQLPDLGNVASADKITELQIFQHINFLKDTDIFQYADKINFNLFNLDLTIQPVFGANVFEAFQLIWIIPILSFATAMISSIITSNFQKKNNPDAPSMRGMMLTMPLISLFIAFTVPGAVGFYWACSNLVSMFIQIGVQRSYTPSKIIAKIEYDTIKQRLVTEQKKMQISDGATD